MVRRISKDCIQELNRLISINLLCQWLLKCSFNSCHLLQKTLLFFFFKDLVSLCERVTEREGETILRLGQMKPGGLGFFRVYHVSARAQHLGHFYTLHCSSWRISIELSWRSGPASLWTSAHVGCYRQQFLSTALQHKPCWWFSSGNLDGPGRALQLEFKLTYSKKKDFSSKKAWDLIFLKEIWL